MKKSRLFMIASSVFAVAMFASVIQTLAAKAKPLRVLDYTYHCVGSGGNCLDTVIVTPE